ncbi:DUF2407 ubiquitin-like domain-containing protein [Cristinia sonorae]|uniref:DUF2407 ubiquitin-like domain-containing protein n=1 Tax=Cristinia sonorae TaxID=1940300 RepID=A0A8K0UGT8_9AGAR|nr:DUF2407 ubiquitin-like domain-containing protein [Cristinia sonorae]
MLSDKAKGKQRAVSPEEERVYKSLVVRFTEGIPDLTVGIEPEETIRDVKRNIRELRPNLKDRRLRLIHSGRLLADDTELYSWITTQEERQRQSSSGEGEESSITPRSTTWLHCSVGPQMSGDEEEDDKMQTAQLKPLRGFDRLSAAGFSEQDIANIRLQFHAHSAGDYLDQEFTNDEDFDEHARMLEEQWIDSMDSAGSASLSQSTSSTSSTLLTGVLTGFFFPLYTLFFFHSTKPAVFWDDGTEHDVVGTIVFSRSMQIWIVVGVVMNFLFGIWTYFLASD